MFKPPSCDGCAFQTAPGSNGYAKGTRSTSGMVLMGGHLSKRDCLSGKAFDPKGQGGSRLKQALQAVGIPANELGYVNLVQCGNPYGEMSLTTQLGMQAVMHCQRERDPILSGAKLIVLMGVDAATVYGQCDGASKNKNSLEYLRGFVRVVNGLPVMITFDPATLAMRHELIPIFQRDLKNAWDYVRGIWNPAADLGLKEYIANPSVAQLTAEYNRLLANPQAIGVDIETKSRNAAPWAVADLKDSLMLDADEDSDDDTQESERGKLMLEDAEITQVQFSVRRHQAYILPWAEPYIGFTRGLMALKNCAKMGANWWNFDAKVLQMHGVSIGGAQIDLMWMWKHYIPLVPKHLQFMASTCRFPFPWKHMYGGNIELYGGCDVDALWYILETIQPEMANWRL